MLSHAKPGSITEVAQERRFPTGNFFSPWKNVLDIV